MRIRLAILVNTILQSCDLNLVAATLLIFYYNNKYSHLYSNRGSSKWSSFTLTAVVS